MAGDRHKLWRLVEYDYAQLIKKAPEGYEPVVEVYLLGRAEPVEIGFVETRDSPDGGTLVRLEGLNRDAEERAEGRAHPRTSGSTWPEVSSSAWRSTSARFEDLRLGVLP